MQNKVVVHFLDGKLVKGFTSDFSPNKDVFRITDKESGESTEVALPQLKAVFFVKDFEGNKDHKDQQEVERTGLGKKIEVKFKDTETIVGYTTGYSLDRTGFFLFPCDPGSNNERIFVVIASTTEIRFI